MNKKSFYIILVAIFFQFNSVNAQWLKTSTDSLETIYALAVSNNNIIAATHTKGILVSSDKGKTWFESNTGLSTNYIKNIFTDKNVIYLATSGYGIYKSMDEGNSWLRIGEGFNGISTVNSIAASGNNLLVAKDGAVIKSSDGGATWDTVNTGLSSLDVRTVFILGNKVFTNIYNDGLYRSSIDNINWVKVSNGLSTYYRTVRAMIVAPTDSNKIYIATDDGVFRSDNRGTSWVPFNNGMESSIVNNLVLIKSNIFAGMASGKGGVMTYSDSSSKWIYLNEGLPEYPYIRGMTAGSDNLYIVNSKENFVRYLPISQITNVENNYQELPIQYKLEQNYPNPFNPTTTINYSIPEVATYEFPLQNHVELKVYDVLGKEVATLINQNQVPGSYKITFDASRLSSGVYYYQLKHGNFLETRKMILLK